MSGACVLYFGKAGETVEKAGGGGVCTPSYALNDTLLFKFSPKDREGSLAEKELICNCLRGVQMCFRAGSIQ